MVAKIRIDHFRSGSSKNIKAISPLGSICLMLQEAQIKIDRVLIFYSGFESQPFYTCISKLFHENVD